MPRKGGRCHPQSNEPRDATLETSRSIMDHNHYDKRENRVTIVPNNGETPAKDFLQHENLHRTIWDYWIIRLFSSIFLMIEKFS